MYLYLHAKDIKIHQLANLFFFNSGAHLPLLCVIYRQHITFQLVDHISVTLLIFSLAVITGNKPLKPALQDSPQLCDRGAHQNTRKAGFLGNAPQPGVKRQKAINGREIFALVIWEAEMRGRELKKRTQLLFWFHFFMTLVEAGALLENVSFSGYSNPDVSPLNKQMGD